MTTLLLMDPKSKLRLVRRFRDMQMMVLKCSRLSLSLQHQKQTGALIFCFLMLARNSDLFEITGPEFPYNA
ncbi:conserved hypothetical protein [Ricinus communis]|uniref:Uncharacterized protein n=1 Tax=Ricinus communis TaxID=3988 RepID=B9SQA0_RICCO|nr:conserved hypothetical protein [Ricinus communis]